MHFINSLGRKSFFLLLCEKVLIFLSSIQWFWMAYFSFTFCFYLNFTTFRSFATVNVNPTLVCGKHELFDVFKTKLNFLSLIKRFFFSQIQLAQPAFTEIWHFDILHRWKSQVYFSVCNWLYCYIYFCLDKYLKLHSPVYESCNLFFVKDKQPINRQQRERERVSAFWHRQRKQSTALHNQLIEKDGRARFNQLPWNRLRRILGIARTYF